MFKKIFRGFLVFGVSVAASFELILLIDRYGHVLGLPRGFGGAVFFLLSGVGLWALIVAEKFGAHFPRDISLAYLVVIPFAVNFIYLYLNFVALKIITNKHSQRFPFAIISAVLLYGALVALAVYILARWHI